MQESINRLALPLSPEINNFAGNLVNRLNLLDYILIFHVPCRGGAQVSARRVLFAQPDCVRAGIRRRLQVISSTNLYSFQRTQVLHGVCKHRCIGLDSCAMHSLLSSRCEQPVGCVPCFLKVSIFSQRLDEHYTTDKAT